mgnify:CR=1 FL=1
MVSRAFAARYGKNLKFSSNLNSKLLWYLVFFVAILESQKNSTDRGVIFWGLNIVLCFLTLKIVENVIKIYKDTRKNDESKGK